ncbi:hypothetical protein, partial [Nocardia jiangxiensis]
MTMIARIMRPLGVVAVLLAASLPTPSATATPTNPELGHVGRWITDAEGRVITLHGVNLVYKYPPFYPRRSWAVGGSAMLAGCHR